MTLDLDALWSFSDPAGSERRFRDAAATGSGEVPEVGVRSAGLVRAGGT
jgi:hypothetical protein